MFLLSHQKSKLVESFVCWNLNPVNKNLIKIQQFWILQKKKKIYEPRTHILKAAAGEDSVLACGEATWNLQEQGNNDDGHNNKSE